MEHNTYICDVTLIPVLIVSVNVRIHFNVRVLYMASTFVSIILLALKSVKSYTTVMKMMTAM